MPYGKARALWDFEMSGDWHIVKLFYTSNKRILYIQQKETYLNKITQGLFEIGP